MSSLRSNILYSRAADLYSALIRIAEYQYSWIK